jgi:hypothetical protein
MASASDNFDRSEDPLSTGWTNYTGANRAFTNAAFTTGAFAGNVSGYSGIGWTADHESTVILAALDASDRDARGIGPAVRCGVAVSSRYAYALKCAQDGSRIVLMGAGDTDDDLATDETDWANGDAATLRIVGSTLIAYKNGVSLYTVNNSALTGTRVPGLQIMRGGNSLDLWSATDISSGIPPAILASLNEA